MKRSSLVLLALLLTSCSGMEINRTDDGVKVRSYRRYTLLYAPDGTIFVDNQGQNEALLTWFKNIVESAVQKGGDSIKWNIGETDQDTTEINIDGG